MRRRLPIVPTIVVALAIAAMIGLGIWQLQRLQQKEALLARLAANAHLPDLDATGLASGDTLLFRRAYAMCVRPGGWTVAGGRNAAGEPGWRQIVTCGASGLIVQAGVARTPDVKPVWAGGAVRGYLTHAPSDRPLIAALFDHTPARLMLVADPPLAGLDANLAPDLSAIPNNHLAYAVQWFLFAGVAAVIYGLALRRRMRTPPATSLVTPPPSR